MAKITDDLKSMAEWWAASTDAERAILWQFEAEQTRVVEQFGRSTE
jgi:hypothetical protein